MGALAGKADGGRKVDLRLKGRLLPLIDGFHMVVVFAMRNWDRLPVNEIYVVSSDVEGKMVMYDHELKSCGRAQASPVPNPSNHDGHCISASSSLYRLHDHQNMQEQNNRNELRVSLSSIFLLSNTEVIVRLPRNKKNSLLRTIRHVCNRKT